MKKFLALVTLICMVMTASVAFAAFPSKTAQDMTTVTCDFDGWAICVTEPSELIEEVVKRMGEHVATEPIVTFFDEDVQEKIPEFKPEAVADVNELVAYELVPVACVGYMAEYGDAYADFVFASAYEEGTELTVMLGLPKEYVEENTDVLTWSVQKCVVENGEVRVLFQQEELLQMEQKIPALMVVLSAALV